MLIKSQNKPNFILIWPPKIRGAIVLAVTVNYVYDDLNRLTSATATSVASGQSTYTKTYTYNAIGNITAGDAGNYTYDGDQGSSYANPHAVTTTSTGSKTYIYDHNGNLLTETSGLSNTWDYNNRLTQAIKGGVTSNYTYDQDGQRVKLDNGTTVTKYPNKYYNYDGTRKTKSIYAGDTLVATVETASAVVTPYYDHTDHLGSVGVTTNNSGAQVELLDYYPFGGHRISSGSNISQKQYIGQIYDGDTDLSYLNARYYEGSRGQFISQDSVFWDFDSKLNQFLSEPQVQNSGKTMGRLNSVSAFGWRKNMQSRAGSMSGWAEFLADPQMQNSYSYGRNNPITMSDPDGNAAYYFSFNTNAGIGGEVGNSWNIGFATDGTFGITTSLHGGGLAGVDASIGISGGYSTAKTWSDTLGVDNYVSVGGKAIAGASVNTNFSDGKYSGTEVGTGIGLRLSPVAIPVTFSGGVSKTIPIFQGSISGIVNGVKNAASSVVNSVSNGAKKILNKLTN